MKRMNQKPISVLVLSLAVATQACDPAASRGIEVEPLSPRNAETLDIFLAETSAGLEESAALEPLSSTSCYNGVATAEITYRRTKAARPATALAVDAASLTAEDAPPTEGPEQAALATGFAGEIQDQAEAMASGSAADSRAAHDWWFRRIWVRSRPKVGIEIPGIAKSRIVPELDLLWDRPMPSGWTGYKPLLPAALSDEEVSSGRGAVSRSANS
jgi:hypothetical protein